jgi:hypothetical protein
MVATGAMVLPVVQEIIDPSVRVPQANMIRDAS